MIVRLLKQLLANDKGGTAIEYGLIAALVVLTMLAALIGVADTTVGMWGNINAKVANAQAPH